MLVRQKLEHGSLQSASKTVTRHKDHINRNESTLRSKYIEIQEGINVK